MGNARLGLVIAVAAWISGCTVVKGYVADFDEGRAESFCQTQKANPHVARLAGKLPIVHVSEVTAAMLALDDVPTSDDVEAIKVLSRDQQLCRSKIQSVTRDHWPTQSATLQALYAKLDLVTAQLIQRKISYGTANRLFVEASLDAESALSADRKDQLEKSRAQDALAWRTVGDGIRAIAGKKQPEGARNDCDWSGATLSCE